MNSLNRFADHVYCIARLIIGLMFACHGGQKILGFPAGGHGGAEGLMLVGAFFAAGEMAVGYFMMHAKMGFFPIVNKGELAVAYCWFFLFVLFYGPGRWSIDALISKRKGAASVSAA